MSGKVSPEVSDTPTKEMPELKSHPTSRVSVARGLTATDHCLDPSFFDAAVVPTVVIVDWEASAAMVIAEAPDFVWSATEVAVSVTEAGLGTTVGAIKVTDVEVTLEREPQVAP